MTDFRHTTFRTVGQRVCRLGMALNDGIDALVKLKEEGKVRSIGVSIHDRVRAGRLAEDSPLDLLMIRCNAALPGAEKTFSLKTSRNGCETLAHVFTGER